MVIFIHLTPSTSAIQDTNYPLLSGHGLYNLLALVMSHGICHIAVPTFFFISGFLFFLKDPDLSYSTYVDKIKRRFYTLVIPYFLWNLVAIMFSLMDLLLLVKVRNVPFDNVYNLINKGWHLFYDSEQWGTYVNWLGHPIASYSPHDVPLWFLRDLIVVSIVSPLIRLYVRKLKIWGMALMFIAYISKIWILLPGFSISAFFFFTLGAYFAINRINIISFVNHYKVLLMIVALLSFLLVCWTNGNASTIGRSLVAVFSTVGVFVAFYISAELIMRYDLRPNKLLVSSCFFVYAMHTIGATFCPLWLSKLMIHFVIPGQTELENCICYIVSPFITAAMCIATYALCVKLSPKVASVLSGG